MRPCEPAPGRRRWVASSARFGGGLVGGGSGGL
ncbi:MAG: hypothetical protein RLZ51_2582, partial [Pseudomonadota bacterium]